MSGDVICSCFSEMIRAKIVSFYSFKDESSKETIYCMPYVGGSNVRFNNCPSCGESVRGIKISEGEMKELLIS